MVVLRFATSPTRSPGVGEPPKNSAMSDVPSPINSKPARLLSQYGAMVPLLTITVCPPAMRGTHTSSKNRSVEMNVAVRHRDNS